MFESTFPLARRAGVILLAILVFGFIPGQSIRAATDTNDSSFINDSEGLTPIVLQLQWNHQFQFAGYYAALKQGYYRDAGLAVTIRDGGYDATGNAVNPEEEVLFGRAQFGVTRTDLLIHHADGLPVVVIANIMQRSPFIMMTLDQYGFDRLEDIGNERPITLSITKSPGERIDADANAAMLKAGVALDGLNNSKPTWVLEDLYQGKTQLIPAYNTDEPYFVKKAGHSPVTISPEQYDINFYGDLLFTSESMIRTQPELVERFRDASLRGWAYALNNLEETARLITNGYQTRNPDYDLSFLIYEAHKTRTLIDPDVIEIGYINPSRWKQIAKIYQSLGLIDNYDLDRFLYFGPNVGLWETYGYWLVVTPAGFIASLVVIFYFFFLNRRLRFEVARRARAETKLKRLAQMDGLTGIDNRYKFQKNINREFLRARRHRSRLSVLMIDLDDFKMVNDQFGHLAGDEVLKTFTRKTQHLLRETDEFGRFGGEEFAVLLPETDISDAVTMAERILASTRENGVEFDGKQISYTVSIGIAEIADSDREWNDLLARCDEMLYRAKDSGKNCIYTIHQAA